jgi:cobalt/nickel transport system permease protein
MHIPDGFLASPVWGACGLLSGSLVVAGLRQVSRRVEEKNIPLMGVLSAFVFAAQMVNLPVGGGTSAHFLGAALVGILLGPWSGLSVMTVVLLVQCFLFQDGGIAALGANILDMGVIGSLGSAWLFRVFAGASQKPQRVFWGGFWAAFLSVAGSAVCCAALLSVSGVVSWKVGLTLIGGVHIVLGLLEGIVTGTVLQAIQTTRPDLFGRLKV